jgi:hypothetical protein
MPASAVDVVRPAVDHTVKQLFKPFRLGQWIRLAVTGLLAGELGTSGGCSFQLPWRPSNRSEQFLAQAVGPRSLLWVVGITALVVLVLVVAVALIYVSSRMRFVLFDSVVSKECRIAAFWRNRSVPAFRYFVFQLLLLSAVAGAFAFFASVATIIAFGTGWVRNPSQHIVPIVIIVAAFILILAVFFVIAFLISVLTKDFVVPQMALEGASVIDGWHRLWSMLTAEKGGYAAYIGLKIVLTIAAAVAVGIAGLLLVLALLIPFGLVGLVVVLAARAIGIGWNVLTITLAVLVGCVVLAALVFGLLLISVPTIVFFPAYSIYFLAARYQPLSVVLYPLPPPPAENSGTVA